MNIELFTKKYFLGKRRSKEWPTPGENVRDHAVAISCLICNYFLFELKLSTVFNKIKGSEQFRNTLLTLLI